MPASLLRPPSPDEAHLGACLSTRRHRALDRPRKGPGCSIFERPGRIRIGPGRSSINGVDAPCRPPGAKVEVSTGHQRRRPWDRLAWACPAEARTPDGLKGLKRCRSRRTAKSAGSFRTHTSWTRCAAGGPCRRLRPSQDCRIGWREAGCAGPGGAARREAAPRHRLLLASRRCRRVGPNPADQATEIARLPSWTARISAHSARSAAATSRLSRLRPCARHSG